MTTKSTNKHYFPFTFFEGKAIPTEQANVSIMTNALQYGTGVFAGIRGYYDPKAKHLSIFRIADHYTRFLSCLKILGVTLPYTHSQLIDITLKLAAQNQPQTDTYFRPFAYAHQTILSPNLANTPNFEFALYMIPLGDYLDTSTGLNVCISSWTRISDTMIPARAKISGGYINSALARKEAHDRGFHEAIFLNSHGHVCEGTAENIFIIRNGQLITPPAGDDILEGITRATVIEIAASQGIPVLERSIDRSELYIADEAFFSGTGAQIAWISQVDGRTISPSRGPLTSSIADDYFRIVRGTHPDYQHYCHKVSTG